MDKPRHPGETSRAPRSHRVDEDFLLIECLRNKVQDPDGLQFHAGDLIPTFDIFSLYPPEAYLQENPAEQKEVWYLFCPKERLQQWGRSPSDQSVGDGFWRESYPREDIVDEQTQKIAEKRILRYRNWTMHELRLVDSQEAESSSTAEKAVKDNPSDNQDSTEEDKLTSPSPFYVLCKIFEEEAAKKQKEDESVDGGIKEEANTATQGQVGQSNEGPDDPLDSDDPAENYHEQTERDSSESSLKTTSADLGTSCSSMTSNSGPGDFDPGTPTESTTQDDDSCISS